MLNSSNEKEGSTVLDFRQKRKSNSTHIFMMGLQSVATFGVPAFAAFFLGWWLDTRFQTGRTMVFYLLGGAFLLSCVLFYLHLKYFMRNGKT